MRCTSGLTKGTKLLPTLTPISMLSLRYGARTYGTKVSTDIHIRIILAGLPQEGENKNATNRTNLELVCFPPNLFSSSKSILSSITYTIESDMTNNTFTPSGEIDRGGSYDVRREVQSLRAWRSCGTEW